MSEPHTRTTHAAQAAYALGCHNFARGEDETAHEAFRTLLRTRDGSADDDYRPGLLDSYVQLGLTYYPLGRPQEAVEQWAYVLQRGPSVGDAQMYLQGVQGQSTRDDASG